MKCDDADAPAAHLLYASRDVLNPSNLLHGLQPSAATLSNICSARGRCSAHRPRVEEALAELRELLACLVRQVATSDSDNQRFLRLLRESRK